MAQTALPEIEQLPPALGLSHGTITSILQDRQGFLWFGTWWGLAKYDGYTVRFYKQSPGSEGGLSSNKISALLEDRQGRIWIATVNAGLCRFDPRTETITTLPLPLSNNHIWALCEDQAGFIWIGTEKGLGRLDPSTEQLEAFDPAALPELHHRFIYSLSATDDGSVWVGTTTGLFRLLQMAGDGWQLRACPTATAREKGLERSAAQFIYQIRPSHRTKGLLWVGSKGGLKKLRFEPGQPTAARLEKGFVAESGRSSSLSHNYVTDILEPRQGSGLWIATFHGLNYFEPETEQFYRFVAEDDGPSINNNLVMALAEDRTGILWIGTEKGVNKSNAGPAPFRSVQLSPARNATRNVVAALAPGRAQPGVWVGTRGGGLCFWQAGNGAKNPARPLDFKTRGMAPTKDFISGLCLDRRGRLWISTHGAGVLRTDEASLPIRGGPVANFEQFTVEGDRKAINDAYVMAVFEAGDGAVWLGMWDAGLCRYDPATEAFTPFHLAGALNVDAFPNVHFAETTEQRQPVLWVATRGQGLLKLRYEPGANRLALSCHFLHQAGHAVSLNSNVVNSLYADRQGNLWIGTEAGLDLLLAGSTEIQHIGRDDQSADGVVQGIIESVDGAIWVSTQAGMYSVRRKNDAFELRRFTGAGDLDGNYFYEPAVCALPEGRLLFGGVNGLTVFDPTNVQENRQPPPVAVTGFRLFNKPVPVGAEYNGRVIVPGSLGEPGGITLEYSENVIAFEFAALQYDHPEKNRFSYRLRGFHQDWITTGADQRLAHYTNLPPGYYVFEVRAGNADGVWSEAPATVALRVLPPWYRTGWAYAAYTMLLLALLWTVRRVALMRFEFRQRLAVEQLGREKIEEVSRIKTQFFTNISHELRTPLTLILTPLEQLIREVRTDARLHQLYTVMHHNAARLHTMVNQLFDLRKGEEGMMRLQASDDDIVEFLQEIVLSFRSWAEQRRVELQFGPFPERLTVCFDHEQLEKVFYNLLFNALKYTPAGGRVQLSIEHTDTEVCIYTADSGPGIPATETERIFDRFYQVEQQQTDHHEGGAGIGLALVKMIVERHGGRVSVQSEEGLGSCFLVRLPLGNAHLSTADRAEQTPSQQRVGLDMLPAPLLTNPATALSEEETTPRRHKPHILIVEDNEDISRFLVEHLSGEFRTETAVHGAEGLQRALAYPPDLVISDIAMPVMDGIELCRHLKRHMATSHVPVVLLTARTSLIFKIDGLETGADDYITKPFNFQLLLIRIRNLIRTREQLREKFSRLRHDYTPELPTTNPLDEAFLRNIIASIERHLEDSDYSVDQLAVELHMSRIQVYRKLKALTGDAPNVFIRQQRLKKAAALLASGLFTVAEVTYKVGYTDLKHFREQFRKMFGVSPSEYN